MILTNIKNKNMKELINFDNEKDIEEQNDFLRAEYKSSIKLDILILKEILFIK